MIRKSLGKISLILIFISVFYFCFDFLNKINLKSKEIKEIEIFFKNYDNSGNKVENKFSDYLMVIEIPNINLQQGIYSINHKNNNIDSNVTILKESIMPDQDNSLLFLAAHSGNSNYSYFRDLNKLELNDEVIIYYNQKKYIYYINNIYTVPKKFDFYIKNNSTSKIVLITCLDDYNYLILEGI